MVSIQWKNPAKELPKGEIACLIGIDGSYKGFVDVAFYRESDNKWYCVMHPYTYSADKVWRWLSLEHIRDLAIEKDLTLPDGLHEDLVDKTECKNFNDLHIRCGLGEVRRQLLRQ
jgi:hypothetical protein